MFESNNVPKIFTFLPLLLAALFPIKLPTKGMKCCLRQTNVLKFAGEDTRHRPLLPTSFPGPFPLQGKGPGNEVTLLRARACGARWLVPTVRICTSPCEIMTTGRLRAVPHLPSPSLAQLHSSFRASLFFRSILETRPTITENWYELPVV